MIKYQFHDYQVHNDYNINGYLMIVVEARRTQPHQSTLLRSYCTMLGLNK